MPLLAELSDTTQIILALIVAGAPLVNLWLTHKAKMAILEAGEAREAKADKNAKDLKDDFKNVKDATDGMKDALVKATGAERYAQGGIDERKRSDTAAENQAIGVASARAAGPSPVEIVNHPSDPVPVIEAKATDKST